MPNVRILQDVVHHQRREVVHVSGHDFQQVVVGAACGVAFHDVRLGAHSIVERRRAFRGLFFHRHEHERRDGEIERSLIENGGIPVDDAGPFQNAKSSQTGGLGQSGARRERDVGDAPVLLESREDGAVGGFQLHWWNSPR